MSQFFIAGVLAAVNPCGFILLPTYLMYYLGVDQDENVSQRMALRRALGVAGALGIGFMVVFIAVASVTNFFTDFILENAKWATAVFGLALIGLGVAMLFGKKFTFVTPQISTGQKDRTFRSMFIYGVAYAVASLSCTLPLFLGAVFSQGRARGVWTGVQNGLAYSIGMLVIVGGLTVALAFARTGLLKFLRRVMQYMDKITAAFVIVAGLYLLWFFYWFDLREEGDPITDWVQAQQAEVSTFLNNHQWGVAVTLFSVVGATLMYVFIRRAAVLVGTLVVGLALGLAFANDWRAVVIIAASVAVAGIIGLRSDDGPSDVMAADDEPSEDEPVEGEPVSESCYTETPGPDPALT